MKWDIRSDPTDTDNLHLDPEEKHPAQRMLPHTDVVVKLELNKGHWEEIRIKDSVVSVMDVLLKIYAMKSKAPYSVKGLVPVGCGGMYVVKLV